MPTRPCSSRHAKASAHPVQEAAQRSFLLGKQVAGGTQATLRRYTRAPDPAKGFPQETWKDPHLPVAESHAGANGTGAEASWAGTDRDMRESLRS